MRLFPGLFGLADRVPVYFLEVMDGRLKLPLAPAGFNATHRKTVRALATFHLAEDRFHTLAAQAVEIATAWWFGITKGRTLLVVLFRRDQQFPVLGLGGEVGFGAIPRVSQCYAKDAPAAEMPGTQSNRKHLAIYAGELALKPDFRLLQGHR